MEAFTFKCERCSRAFEPDPSMVLPVTWTKLELDEADDDMEDYLTPEELAEASVEDLAGLGLTLADRDALLAGVEVQIGARIVCRSCQSEM
jgi:DNA-directed RNA polymerase subunit RPC12/RpoP